MSSVTVSERIFVTVRVSALSKENPGTAVTLILMNESHIQLKESLNSESISVKFRIHSHDRESRRQALSGDFRETVFFIEPVRR